MPDIHDLTAVDLSARYGSAELSPVEVVRALLDRIERWEPHINAMYRVDTEGALAQARASEARWRSGAPLSRLDGVPITIKENIYTRGDPAPLGTAANRDVAPAGADAPSSARVREAGCVILGKTTMPDYGMLSSGVSSLHGITRNPWQLDRNTSGSSSGAAAAAVAGYAPLHLGTDIGGSVRLPATHCGIFALKPSLGRVPIYPPYLGRVVGPMTRSVGDAALLLGELAKPDARDFMSLPYAAVDYAAQLEGMDVAGLRIGLFVDPKVGLPVHPEVRAASEAAAQTLAAAGAIVEPLPTFLDDALLGGIYRFFEIRLYHELMGLAPERRAAVLPFVAQWCSARAAGFGGRDVMDAYGRVMALRETTVRACQPFDYVIGPTSPILPYEATSAAPGDDPLDAFPHIALTVPYSMSEQPAASVNWTTAANGLPIGIQVIGRRFDDAGVLRLARVLEIMRPKQRSWPNAAAANTAAANT